MHFQRKLRPLEPAEIVCRFVMFTFFNEWAEATYGLISGLDGIPKR
jgi:hypothetical protein